MSFLMRKWTARHEGGTKDYRIVLLETLNWYFVITRWGKTGSVGQCKVESFATSGEAQGLFDKTKRSKARRGYDEISHTHKTYDTIADAISTEPTLMSRARSMSPELDREVRSAMAGVVVKTIKPDVPNDPEKPDPRAEIAAKQEQIADWGAFS